MVAHLLATTVRDVSAQDTALKRPALYNPALWSRAEVRTYYVARHALLARIIDDFRREKQGSRPQHRLILGQRGMGKSTLLRRLAIGVEDDPELAGQWLALTFPEEQYNVATLADFWLNCLDALSDTLEARGDVVGMRVVDVEVERLDRTDGEGALQTLLRMAKKLDRRLLLLVDNIDLILERIKNKDWVLREALQAHPELLLVGASSRALESTYDYGAAFYDFFRIDELRGLSETEMRDTIVALARQRGADELVRSIESDPGRLRALHTLTGGNPRTAVLLYGVLLKGVDGNVRSDLEGLLDEVTPLYKARFDELPTQAQQLLDKVALRWNPITARQAADALAWTVNLASAQLDRLVQAGVIEKVKAGKGKRMAFQVAERFFNIWYLMRASRRVRRRLMWLVEFLRVWFRTDDLQRQAESRLGSGCADTAGAEYDLALSRAIGASPLARALETQALAALLAEGSACLDDMFDLRGEDRDLATRAERIQIRKRARDRFESMLVGAEDAATMVEALVGLPLDPHELIALAEDLKPIGQEGVLRLRHFAAEMQASQERYLGKLAYSFIHRALLAGDMSDLKDVEGGEAAKLRYGQPLLALVPLIYNGQLREAQQIDLVDIARSYLELDPSGAIGWYALGQGLSARASERDRAIEALRRAVAIDPSAHQIVRALAWRLAEDEARRSEAAELFGRVLESSPDDADARRGMMTVLGGDPQNRASVIEIARSLCASKPDDPRNWCFLATFLLAWPGAADEQLAAARRAVELGPEHGESLWVLANSLLFYGHSSEGLAVSRKWFMLLNLAEEIASQEISRVCILLRGACVSGVAREMLHEIDTAGVADRLRPAREALAAAAEGSIEVLNGVAPEIRRPALELLARIDPKLADRALSGASI
jgi:tetratricopeptide (TPR) repeat protein